VHLKINYNRFLIFKVSLILTLKSITFFHELDIRSTSVVLLVCDPSYSEGDTKIRFLILLRVKVQYRPQWTIISFIFYILQLLRKLTHPFQKNIEQKQHIRWGLIP
jgi:hypothetical protein